MLYAYECEKCGKTFDVVKPVDKHREKEFHCNQEAKRLFITSRPIIDHTWAEYYPSLGTVVKSKYHRNELMKKNDLMEIGNEKPETIHKEMKKTLDHKLKTRWDKDD